MLGLLSSHAPERRVATGLRLVRECLHLVELVIINLTQAAAIIVVVANDPRLCLLGARHIVLTLHDGRPYFVRYFRPQVLEVNFGIVTRGDAFWAC